MIISVLTNAEKLQKTITSLKKGILLLLLVGCLYIQAVAQNTFDLVGLTSATPSVGGYSLRLLSSSYTGPLVRITIGSSYYDVFPDATTKNFALTSKISAAYGSFNASATGATSNALFSVLGSNSASVAIWYDQSGNGRNVSQATTASQPSIVTAGTINLKNGAPTVYFNNQKLSSANFANAYNNAFSLALVAGVKNDLSLNTFVSKTNGNQPSPFDFYNSNMLYGASGSFNSWFFTQGFSSANGFSQWTFTANNAGAKAFRNGIANNTSSTTTSINDNLSTPLIFGSRADGNSALDGWISEVLTFNNVLSTPDQILIEANQTAAYPPPPIVTSFTPTSAGPGTTVTITGNYFNGAATVSFGGVGAASFTVVSNNTVTAVVPAGASGSVSVTSPSGTGTLAGFDYTPLVPPGNALDFDGANDFVEMIDNPSINYGGTSFTWGAWINFTDSQPNYAGVLAKVLGTLKGVQLVLVDNKIAAEFFGGGSAVGVGNGLVGTTPLNDGRWHHVAMVLDATAMNMKLYVDGQVEANVNSSLLSSNIDNSASLFIGTERTAIAFYKGRIDEIRLYNTALTQANIQADMTSIAPSEPASLTSYFDFDEGSAGGSNSAITTLIDSKSFYHGNLKNFTLSGANSNWVESYAMVVPVSSAATAIGGASFTANWAAPAIGTVNNYLLDVSTSATFSSFVSGYNGFSLAGTSQAVTGLTQGTAYYFRVRADKTSVTGQSAYSAAVTVNTSLISPTITSFSPTASPISSSITLTGTNFSTTPSNNIVYFGAVKASVTAATATQLTVTVPLGAQYSFVSVLNTVTGLIAYSTYPFNPTFSDGIGLTLGSFLPKVDFTTGTNPSAVAYGDLDGDAKPDLVVTNFGSNTVSIFQNTSSGVGNVSYGPKVDFGTATGPSGVSLADLDQDGKLDIVVVNQTSNSVSVLRNTGSFTFAAKVDFATGNNPHTLSIADIDGDGRLDVAVPNFTSATVSVFKNNGTGPGTISFVPKVDFITGAGAYAVAFADFDTDSKPDMVVTNYTGNTVSTFKNISSSAIAFNAKVDFSTGTNPISVTVGDFNGDNKLDVATANTGANTISVLLNNTVGAISLATKVDYVGGTSPIAIVSSDLDGDNKIDLGLVSNVSSTLSIFRGNGGGVFAPKVDFTAGAATAAIAVGDADGDKKQDIAVANALSNSLSILRYTNLPTLASFTPTTAASGATVTITGTNFTGATAVSFGGTAATSFNVVSATSITAVVASGTSGIVSVTTPGGTGTLAAFVFMPAPTIASFTPTLAGTGTTVTITGTNFTGATDVKFGGVSATSFNVVSSTSISAVVASGASGAVTVTGPGGTGTLAGFTLIGAPTITSFTPTSSVSGGTVTITGTNFVGVTAVSFGGTSATSFNVVSSTSITAVVASGTSGLVLVTATGGTATLAGFTFIPPAPTITSFTPTTAASGATVTIMGTNFTGATTVSFGGTAATSFNVLSSTSITAVVASGASGIVSVTTPGGTGTLSGFTFVPAPTITSFTPTSAGSATTLSITGMNFTGATAVSFGGTAATSFNVLSSTSITAVVASGASGIVSVTTPGGTGTLAGFIFIPAPTIASFTPTTAGGGATVTITGTNFTGATGVSFGGTAASSFNIVSATSITAVVASGASGIVSVTTLGGTGTRAGFSFIPAPTITSFTPTTAASGATVTITGTNFTGASAVSFGGTAAASFTVVASTSITASIATGTSGIISVTTPGGTGTLPGFSFTPAPTITSFSPTTAASGSTVTITGTNFTGATAVSFGGALASSFSVVSSTSITAFVATGSTGNVSVTTPGGTATASGFTFIPAPAITSFTPASAASGGTVTIAGIDLADVTSVSFGGVPATSFTVVSSTSITALVGTGASGSVSVTAPGGTGTLAGFTLIGGPTLSDFTPTSAASGATVTINGTNFIGVTDVSFGGVAAASFNVVSSTSITAVVASGASGQVSVNATGGIATSPDFVFIPAPTITSFTPNSAISGDSVTLIGANFTGATAVSFGGTSAASFTVDSDTKITAVVATGSSGAVSVTTSGGSGTAPGFVFIPAPTITSFTPTTALTGTSVTITGTNLSDASAVSFGGVPASSFTVDSNTSITAVVASGSSGDVSVTTPGGTVTKSGFAFVAPPVISSFTPTQGATGATVTITGNYFTGATSVTFGGVAATSFSVVSNTSITAVVGAGVTGDISITTPFGTVAAAGFNFIQNPTIDSFSPTTAGAGARITVTGTNFTGTSAVSFGGVAAASFSVISSSTISAVVSTGATGDVTVTNQAGSITLAGFTFIPKPTITSFAPTAAAAGAQVTITGTYLADITGVFFGGLPAVSFTVVSSTSITAVVGSGSSGSVSLTSPSGSVSIEGFVFVKAPTISSLAPTVAAEGAMVTIKGASFTGTTAVSFGGTPATAFTVVSDNTITAVVAAGATGNVLVTNAGGTTALAGFTFSPAPIITSVFPASGEVGTPITIIGNGFNTTAANNIVFFGATKATVTAATATQLSVTVPAGATYAPVTLLNVGAGLVAYSPLNFTPVFSPNKGNIIAADFSTKVDFNTTSNNSSVATGDLDGDGKADLVFVNGDKNTISVSRNTTSTNNATFADNITFAAGTNPSAVAIGDIDGDGKLDLAIANNGSNSLSIFRNTSTNGTFSFADKVDLTTGSNPQAVAIGDLDSDGKPDLAVANFNSASVSVFQNSGTVGTITFATSIDFTTGFGPYAVAIGDLDSNGKADLTVANYSSGTVSVLRSKGIKRTISFDRNIDIVTGARPNAVSIGDLNGDGKSDLVVSNYSSNTVSILRSIGKEETIKYAAKVDVITGELPVAFALGDLNGDGRADLAVANSNSPTISIFRNTSVTDTLRYVAKVDLAIGSPANSIAINDLDGDGKADLAFATAGKNSFSIIKTNPLFPPTITGFTPAAAASGGIVTITGTNFDAIKSVKFGGIDAVSFSVTSSTTINAIVSTGATGDVTVTTPAGVATLAGFVFVRSNPSITSFSPVTGAVGSEVIIAGTNFNETATDNIVFFGATKATVTSASANQLKVTVPSGATYAPITVLNSTTSFLAYSTGNFTPSFASDKGRVNSSFFTTKVDLPAASKPQFAAVSDLDGDGKAELVSVNTTSNSISVFRNTSTGGKVSYDAKVDYATGTNPLSVAVGDLDGDGKSDIAVANKDNASVCVFLNTSTGSTLSFAAKADFPSGQNPTYVAIGDLDGDGKADLAIANSTSNNVSVLRNNGSTGTVAFAAKVDFAVGANPQAVAIADVDGDTRADLAVANYRSNNVSILRNAGAAGKINFAPKVDLVSGFGPFSIAIGDLDGDLLADLAVVSQTGDSFSVFRNVTTNGKLAYAARADYATGKSPYSIALGDLDGDGKPDVAVANQLSDNASVFSNNSTTGAISFASKIDFVTGKTPFAVAISDADGDGKSDLVVSSASSAANAVSVFRNNPVLPPTITSFTPVTAASGATVTITGTNFTDATAVSFGGTAASSYTVVSATSITAALSIGASGNVSVTTDGGTATRSGFTFIPTPTITAIAPTIAGLGAAVTITGTNLTGATAVKFGDVPATSFAVVSATSLTAIVPANAGSSISITTPGGTVAFAGFVFVPAPIIASFEPTSAGAGTTVTITGTDFTGATVVSFGGVAASSYTVVSPTSITAVVGAGASGSVSVATLGGAASRDGFTYLDSSPIITSFAPTSGATGTSITITGSRFNSTAANNVVFFGAARATVTAATDTELKVTVPAGATFAPLTVLNATNGLLAYSTANFTPTFSPTKGSITSADFSAKVDLNAGGSLRLVAAGDFDGDGKVDLAVANNTSNTVSLYRNTTTNNTLTYADKVDVATGVGPYAIAVADLDGDSKPDLAVTNSTGNSVSVLRNTTTASALSFATKVDVATGATPQFVAVGDVDGDGKADLAIANTGAATVSVLRNVGNAGVIKFATKADFTTGSSPYAVAVADVDGDSKADLTVANNGSDNISVLINKSIAGTVDYAAKVDVASNSKPYALAVGDVDGDGKLDIAVANNGSNNISVFQNTTTNTQVSFAAKVDFVTAGLPASIAMGDLDGDGKADLAVTNLDDSKVSVFRNTNASAQVSFATKVDIATGTNPVSVTIADFDRDGKPDLATANFGSGTVSVIKNNSVSGIVKQDQTISFGSLADKLAADAPFNLLATSSSGLAVAFASTNDKVTVSGNKVTIAKAGRATITASQAGDANYNAAVSVNRSFCIKPAKPTITLSNANTDALTLTSSATAGNQWFRNGILITGAINTTYAATQVGSYTVQVKMDDCASDFSNAQVLAVTGDIDPSTEVRVEVYPVPAHDWLYVSFTHENGQKQLTTFDLTGRVIATEEATGKEARLEVVNYAQGLYYLRVVEGNKTSVIRFTIQ
jgi:hypothetical protein